MCAWVVGRRKDVKRQVLERKKTKINKIQQVLEREKQNQQDPAQEVTCTTYCEDQLNLNSSVEVCRSFLCIFRQKHMFLFNPFTSCIASLVFLLRLPTSNKWPSYALCTLLKDNAVTGRPSKMGRDRSSLEIGLWPSGFTFAFEPFTPSSWTQLLISRFDHFAVDIQTDMVDKWKLMSFDRWAGRLFWIFKIKLWKIWSAEQT